MNLKINEKCGKFELHIKNNSLKYGILVAIFLFGIITGGICFQSLKNNAENLNLTKDLIIQIMENINCEKLIVVNEYFFKDIKKIILLIIISFSMIGVPLLLVWIFYEGVTLSFTIINLIYAYGVIKGNIISLLLFIPNLFSLFAIIIITVSSVKLVNNFFRMRKSLKMETIRHLIVCAFAASIIGIGFFIRIILLNFIGNWLKIQ